MSGLDGQAYWKQRHLQMRSRLGATGFQHASEDANFWSYRLVAEQYQRLLPLLIPSRQMRVLDAGAGRGYFTQLLAEASDHVTAVDVSHAALSDIAVAGVGRVVCPLDRMPFADQSFDVVQCFDVLYHILNDQEWHRAIDGLCRCARRHVVLHERFMEQPHRLSSPIVRAHPYWETAAALWANGFAEVLSIPTHVVGQRLFTYVLAGLVPRLAYRVDRQLLDAVSLGPLQCWGSHHIKVFERRG